jgi:hypothetical protein
MSRYHSHVARHVPIRGYPGVACALHGSAASDDRDAGPFALHAHTRSQKNCATAATMLSMSVNGFLR